MSKTKLPFSAGKAGAGTVDIVSGKLEYTIPLAEFKEIFDWNVSLVYNPNMSAHAKNYKGGFLFNSHWKLNFSQLLISPAASTNYYTYIDAMGNEHKLYIYIFDSHYDYCKDIKGEGYHLSFRKNTNDAYADERLVGELSTPDGTVLKFRFGQLIEVKNGNKIIQIGYNALDYDIAGKSISSIMDSNNNGIRIVSTEFEKKPLDFVEVRKTNKYENDFYPKFNNSFLTSLDTKKDISSAEITFEYSGTNLSKVIRGTDKTEFSYYNDKVTSITNCIGGEYFTTSVNFLSRKTIVTDPFGVSAAFVFHNEDTAICRYEEINGEPAGIVEYSKTVDNTTVTASVPVSPGGDNLICCLPYGGTGVADISGIEPDRIYTLCGWVDGGDSGSGLKTTVNGVQYSCNFDSNVSGKQFAAAAFKSSGTAQNVIIETFGSGAFTNVCLYKGGSARTSNTACYEVTYEIPKPIDDPRNPQEIFEENGFKTDSITVNFSDLTFWHYSASVSDMVQIPCSQFTYSDFISTLRFNDEKPEEIQNSFLICNNNESIIAVPGTLYIKSPRDTVHTSEFMRSRLVTHTAADYANIETSVYYDTYKKEISGNETIRYNGNEYRSRFDKYSKTDYRNLKAAVSLNGEIATYTAGNLSMKLKTTIDSDENGTTVKSYDARGYCSETCYDKYKKPAYYMNPVVASTSPSEKTVYSKNFLNANVKSKSKTFSDYTMSNALSFTEKDGLITYLNDGSAYYLGYDAFGNLISATAGGAVLLEKSCNLDLANGSSTETSRFNGIKSVSRHDKYGRLINATENGSPVQTNAYGISGSGNLENHTDHITNSEHVFSYDGDGDIKALTVKDKSSGTIKSRATFAKTKDKVTGAQFDIGGRKTNYSYGYDHSPDARLTKTEVKGKFVTETLHDSFGRITVKTLTSTKNNNTIYKEVYSYIANGSDTTPYVDKIDFNNGASSLSYSYDMNGNIISISGAENNSYAYDALNRLTKDNNTEFAYNGNGNRIAKKNGETIEPYSYYYEDYFENDVVFWKDKLVDVAGSEIYYDSVGNPLSYLGAKLTWTRGRMLERYVGNAPSAVPLNVSYSYDAGGLRTSKTCTVNGEPAVHSYTYIGGQLMREYIRKPKTETLYSAGSYCSDSVYCGLLAASQSGVPCEHDVCEIDDLTFHYDQTGIAGFTLRKRMTDTNYFYRKNLQGDIIEIYDENGGHVAAYSYDAWGNCSITHNTRGIAELNPIRYRGYYYDSETKLYYLKSRYYDPAIGRFINADDVRYALAQSQQLNGLNLFAYCLNNPVMLVDYSGHSWESFWNGVGNGISNAWNWVTNTAAPAVGNFFSNPTVQNTLMSIGSSLLIVGGLVCIFTGFGAPLGMGLIAMGTGSLVGGSINVANGGSFFAGWVGGLVSGAASMIPGLGAPIGAFLGSIITDGFNSNWRDIDFAKAGWSALTAWILDSPAIAIGQKMGSALYSDIGIQLALSYRGALISGINGFFNWLFGRK